MPVPEEESPGSCRHEGRKRRHGYTTFAVVAPLPNLAVDVKSNKLLSELKWITRQFDRLCVRGGDFHEYDLDFIYF